MVEVIFDIKLVHEDEKCICVCQISLVGEGSVIRGPADAPRSR